MAEIKTILFRSGLLMWCLLSGTAFGLKKEVPPQITKPVSQDQQIVDFGQGRHTVECSATGDPQPTYQWKRDDQLLDDTQDSIKAFKNGTLYFEYFTDNENGFYQCLATNEYGTSVSVKLPLVNEKTIHVEQSNRTSKPPYPQDAKQGDPVSLNCSKAPPTVPEYSKRWYLTVGSDPPIETDRIGTDAQGTLRFASVELEDAKNYACQHSPPIKKQGVSILISNVVQLNVIPVKDPLLDVGPKIQFRSQNVKALEGKDVTLECFFSGRPVPTITWKSNRNEDITQDSQHFKIDDFGRKLTIIKVEEDDEGDFSCTANNGVGSQPIEHISVNVTSPPMKTPHDGLIHISQVKPDRHDIILTCKAQAAYNENLDRPVWYKNGALLTEANLPERYRFEKDHTELHIQNPDKATDTACFQCNVSNSEGYAFYDAFLKVIDSIKITRSPEERIEISREEIIDISVHADGDSCCKIVKVWSLNGVSLNEAELEQPPFTWNPTSDSLLFDPRSVSNETLASRLGDYTCRISNDYDNLEVKFHISLMAIATVHGELTAGGDGFELWWLALIFGLLAIIIAVIVIIVFVKTNYPRETYPLEKTELKHHLNPKEDLQESYFQEI